MSRRTTLLLFVLGFVTVFLLGWVLLYPSPDPKNITYVLWRAGFHTMDPDAAAGIMVGDVHPERIVLGKTKEQLRSRFGYLTTVAEASLYLQGCYSSSGRRGKEVLFIRKSEWMIVFVDDRAIELVLCKG
jgi:hypothetical protein